MSGGIEPTVGALKDFAKKARATGNLTLNSTSWVDFPTVGTDLDITLAAVAGDEVEVNLAALAGGESVSARLSASTIVSNAVVNRLGGTNGIAAWFATDAEVNGVGGPYSYTIQSGDVVNGTVTFRLQYQTGGAVNKTLYAEAAYPLQWSVKNLGQVRASAVLTSALTPDALPTTPHADDYEFNATAASLPTGWSWANQGTSTYAEAKGYGSVAFQAGGSDELRAIVRAVPAGAAWTATFHAPVALRVASGTVPSRALVLRDSASGKVTAFTQLTDQTTIVDYYTNPTTWSSRPGAALTVFNAPLLEYVRVVKNSATSWDFAVSPDGTTWVTTHSAINVSTHMTPDQIGIGVNSRTNPLALGVDWYRVS